MYSDYTIPLSINVLPVFSSSKKDKPKKKKPTNLSTNPLESYKMFLYFYLFDFYMQNILTEQKEKELSFNLKSFRGSLL